MNDRVKRAFRIAERALVILIVAVTAFMMVFTIVSVVAFGKNNRSIFGLQFYIVKSDSMKATHFKAGDLVVAKKFDMTDPKDLAKLKKGTIITFQSINSDSRGETITHQIIGFETLGGKPIEDKDIKDYIKNKTPFACVTKGTSNNLEDEARVGTEFIYGTYLFDIPNAGTFFHFLKSARGYVICILIPFLLLIGYQGYVCVRLFLRYRSEQLEGIRAREAQLDAEREEARRQMAELAELRAMLSKQMSGESKTRSEDSSDGPEDQTE